MKTIPTHVIDRQIRAVIIKRATRDFGLPENFSPSTKWNHLGWLLETFARELSPHVLFSDEGVWVVKVNGACSVFGDPGQLTYTIAKAVATALYKGEPLDDNAHVSNAQPDRRDQPLSRPRSAPGASKDGDV